MTSLQILSVASEIYPLIKTGGLADVVGALPAAVEPEGIEMSTLVPGYPAVMGKLETSKVVHRFPVLFGGSARLLAGHAGNLELFILDAPHLYSRQGNPYLGPGGADWPDNALRFAALSKVAAAIGLGLLPGYTPDVVHAHDWHAGLAPAYLHYSGHAGPGTVITVHNHGYQGSFPADLLTVLDLPRKALRFDGVEHFGKICFLKAALQLSDRITAVSPSYAVEMQLEESGMGLDGVLRARAGRVSGILNGLDTKVWNPANDRHLDTTYDAGTLEARAANKAALQAEFGLDDEPGTLLTGVISRLTSQKGLDLLLEALPVLLEENMQLALLGAGDTELEEQFQAAAAAHPGRIGVRLGYDEVLAHRIQAGVDALLVPSRYEPCGLTQLAALRYGAIPVVARVGGLADTIIDANEMAVAAGVATGVQFVPVTADALGAALRRTAALYRNGEIWRRIQKNGMATETSWHGPAKRYAALYRDLLAEGSCHSG